MEYDLIGLIRSKVIRCEMYLENTLREEFLNLEYCNSHISNLLAHLGYWYDMQELIKEK